jgi:hypothetical protein
MNEQEKAMVRACLEEVELSLSEAREVGTWWVLLSEGNRQEVKDFVAFVQAARAQLKGIVLSIPPKLN